MGDGTHGSETELPQPLAGPETGSMAGARDGTHGPETLMPQPLAGLLDVEEYIALHHVGSWHWTLNHHASTRPKKYGGPLVKAVTACKTYTEAAPGRWHCTVDLPNSFSPGDGWQLLAEGEGGTQNEASEHTCRRALAVLFMRNPSQVVVRPNQWKVLPDALLANLPGIHGVHQALPVHIPMRSQASGAEGPC